MYRLSFLSSGKGDITATILKAIQKRIIPNVKAISIISDRQSQSLVLGTSFNLNSYLVEFKKYKSREEFSDEILNIFEKEKIDFGFATFDRILSGEILEKYKYKLINIHSSLLPVFPGYNTIKKAADYGCKFIGATCHFIDTGIDSGPIINQAVLPFNSKREAEMEEQLYRLRQKLSLEAIYAFCSRSIKIIHNDVAITKADYSSYPINPSLHISAIDRFLNDYEK